MPTIEHPQKRRKLSGGIRPPEEPRIWDVGVRISNVIRNFKGREPADVGNVNETGSSHASPRPHIRSAHWQAYWTGPRNASFPERKPVLRWIPPIPISMDWKKELPTTIKTVAT